MPTPSGRSCSSTLDFRGLCSSYCIHNILHIWTNTRCVVPIPGFDEVK
jgi:hypothetical protein